MFTKILIANRGEIACRVIQTARRLGIDTVAVFSDADAGARHVRIADEAVRIGPAAVRDSYLKIDSILEAAQRTGARAIHPGYGFLSENAEFAAACGERGIVFIGPPVAAIRAMGSKSAAKRLMESAAVPLVPGYHGEEQDGEFLAVEAAGIGYPVLIKATAGGGGKGMRIVESAAEFAAALASCRREAEASFGDDRVLIERYLLRPRHIEMQIFADALGNCVHLFERDCSVQRRHQKVLEEAPAPGMTASRRAEMGAAAVAAARAVDYMGAGTVEFIVDRQGRFYFMEMNTRLQVEHPVTEMITGLDLVEWQLRVANGELLPLKQPELAIRGHALEARVYAEDPDRGFLPSTGRLVHLVSPAGVRVDRGVEQGDEITPFYDPMIAKLIVWGETREQALRQMGRALAAYQIVGVSHNLEFLSRLVASPAFVAADLDTGLIERERAVLFPEPSPAPREVFLVAALAAVLREQEGSDPRSPWGLLDGWRLNSLGERRCVFRLGEEETTVIVGYREKYFELTVDGVTVGARGALGVNSALRVELAGMASDATVVVWGDRRCVFWGGRSFLLEWVDPLKTVTEGQAVAGLLVAPMPGRVVAWLATPGTVEKGAPLLILEAMKMEHTIRAPTRGRLVGFRFAVGEQVSDGALLADFAEESGS